MIYPEDAYGNRIDHHVFPRDGLGVAVDVNAVGTDVFTLTRLTDTSRPGPATYHFYGVRAPEAGKYTSRALQRAGRNVRDGWEAADDGHGRVHRQRGNLGGVRRRRGQGQDRGAVVVSVELFDRGGNAAAAGSTSRRRTSPTSRSIRARSPPSSRRGSFLSGRNTGVANVHYDEEHGVTGSYNATESAEPSWSYFTASRSRWGRITSARTSPSATPRLARAPPANPSASARFRRRGVENVCDCTPDVFGNNPAGPSLIFRQAREQDGDADADDPTQWTDDASSVYISPPSSRIAEADVRSEFVPTVAERTWRS